MLRSLGEYLYGCRGMINVAQNESIIILFFFPATFDSLAYINRIRPQVRSSRGNRACFYIILLLSCRTKIASKKSLKACERECCTPKYILLLLLLSLL